MIACVVLHGESRSIGIFLSLILVCLAITVKIAARYAGRRREAEVPCFLRCAFDRCQLRLFYLEWYSLLAFVPNMRSGRQHASLRCMHQFTVSYQCHRHQHQAGYVVCNHSPCNSSYMLILYLVQTQMLWIVMCIVKV